MTTRPVHDISPASGLEPKAVFRPDLDDYIVNADGVIALISSYDTPQARAVYRAFRKRYAEARLDTRGRSDRKIKDDALLQALRDVGFRSANMGHMPGTFDDGGEQ